MKFGQILFAFFIFLFTISGCSTSEKTEANLTQEYPVTLFVSNKVYPEPVHISVKIMYGRRLRENEPPYERLVVDKDFAYKPFEPQSFFKINLKEGTYRFLIETNYGNYKIDLTFDVERPLWLNLNYFGKNYLNFQISNHPMVFG